MEQSPGYKVVTTHEVYEQNPRFLNPLTGGWTEGANWVKRLLVINVAFWVIMVLYFRMGPGGEEWWMSNMALTPGLVFHGKIWQIVTSMFLLPVRPDVMFFLLLTFYIFGPKVEQDKGSPWFIKFYLLCGLAGSIFSILVRPIFGEMEFARLGASGAIYGTMAAFCILYHNQTFWVFWKIPVRVLYILYIYMAVDVAWILAPIIESVIDHFANFGGILSAWMFLKTPWFRVSSMREKKPTGPPKPPRTVKRRGKPPSTGGGAKDFLEV